MKLYMAVTSDEYELPLAVARNVEELARMRRKTKGTIMSSISRNTHGRVCGEKYIKIEVEDDDND